MGRVWVAGEASNVRQAGSGHVYFTLKDRDAQLRVILFRSDAARLPFALEDGVELLVLGEPGVWEPRGELRMVARVVEPRGRGALQLAFEQLRARLEREGLFDPARKRVLPEFPRVVGIVSSPEAAALRDVVRVARERFPAIPLLLAPARVQGEGAEQELCAALARIACGDGVDVVLLVRGGGSLEDLMAFNGERLARAIAACPVPLVTGVGHEIDVTIADLAADLRAPTPSAAAACVLPDREAVRLRLGRDAGRLRVAVRATLDRARERSRGAQLALRRVSPAARLAAQRARLASARRSLEQAVRTALERGRGRFERAAGRLHTLSPLAVLGRGYAIVRRAEDQAIVRSPVQVASGDGLHIRVAEGELQAEVRDPGARRR